MTDTYQELPLEEALVKRGVTKMVKQGNFVEGYTILIIVNDKAILFDVHNTKNGKWKKTLENYNIASMGKGLGDQLKAAIALQLINNSKMILGYDHRESLKYEEPEELDDNIKSMSVNEAAHTHSGTVLIRGMVVTRSRLYQLVKKARWRCYSCNELIEREVTNVLETPVRPKECPACGSKEFEDKHDLINTVTLGLHEEEVQEQDNTLDDLDVRVFNDDTVGIQVGEVARIIGDIKSKQDPRTKQYHSVILAKSIEYQNRKKLVLTPADIKGIKKFVSLPNYEQRLVSMFAPDVIGHDQAKLALLISAIGAPETPDKEAKITRGRIHALLIGPPGLAKTKLGKEAKQLRLNSRYASGKRTTGKSLTAMVVRENENEVLRLGPAAHARNAILFINEFDKLPQEDQDNLLEVMDEGMIDMTTFAKEFHIPAATTIIASANPVNNKWMDAHKIDLEEIPFSSIMLNRFDIIIPFRDTSTREDDWKYADTKTSYDERRIKHNYNFLRKLIELAKTIEPTITEQARGTLNSFYVEIKGQGNFASSPRILDAIHRIAKTFARRDLSQVVDEKIATRTIEFMNYMLGDFHSAIYIVPDPFSKSYDETIKVIQHIKVSIDLIEAVKIATERTDQVRLYIGRVFQQRNNRKLRNLCTKILENPNVVRISENPTVVTWKEKLSTRAATEAEVLPRDQCDNCDSENQLPIEKIKKIESGESQKVKKITTNRSQNVPEKNVFEIAEEKAVSQKSQKSQLQDNLTTMFECENHTDNPKAKYEECTENKKKHDIYWSGSQWYCNNCNQHGDKFHMTIETICSGIKGKK
jgi:DNA replicative helicase MCM subunit Mcm2 (Cdc46/Mcm family)